MYGNPSLNNISTNKTHSPKTKPTFQLRSLKKATLNYVVTQLSFEGGFHYVRDDEIFTSWIDVVYSLGAE